ncbi:Glycerophosphoryl diester phosphodiesterase precursor [Stieleria neptunia]|uniref:glycerophosphodiester phosphodiesterase n=1 Tax=Stieleria neptunia TaxID=2527979 RepID=A0A518I0H1_9BACT|nr:glycerophosphodiester phosphodiesterase [Stieleria neptunia]QDV46613.1 Glycerophosphoryl diester phosphodiesterase precursor [Stieleria neptunia]
MTAPVSGPIVIAHRGASGYVPEHTLVAKGIAHAMGADYLEQDVVATKDHHPVVLHDIHLDTVTNVARRFHGRSRPDGRYYAIDFTLAELKTLEVLERFDHRNGRNVFSGRYSGGAGGFRICTLDEEIRFIQNLNRTTGRQVGIYPEIKQPAWHREEGCDLTSIVLQSLDRFGYRKKSDLCFLQCFDEFEVRRIREELSYQGRLIQLVGDGHDARSGTDYSRMKTPEGLADLAKVVDGIGPNLNSVVRWDDSRAANVTDLVAEAHRFGLAVHPWTVRADDLPAGCATLQQLIDTLRQAEVDGLFCDHPDQVLQLLSDSAKR